MVNGADRILCRLDEDPLAPKRVESPKMREIFAEARAKRERSENSPDIAQSPKISPQPSVSPQRSMSPSMSQMSQMSQISSVSVGSRKSSPKSGRGGGGKSRLECIRIKNQI
jgi:hypothetical protein